MNLLTTFGILSAFATIIVCTLNDASLYSAAGGLLLAPLMYSVFLLLYSTYNYGRKHYISVTVRVTVIIQWVRVVLLPFTGVLSGYYSSLQGSNGATACYLFLYENFVIYILLMILSKNDRKRQRIRNDNDISIHSSLHGTGFMYFLFGLVAMAAYFLFLRGSKIFSFVVLDAQKSVVEAEEGNDSIALYVFLMAVILIVLYITEKCSDKYNRTGNKIWIYIALAICLLRILLLTSSGRMGQVYICFGLGAVLMALFPQQRKGILYSILTVSAIVIISVSIYKTFYVSAFGNYKTAVQSSSKDLNLIATQIDGYLAGPGMISSNLSFIESNNVPYSTLFYDIGRNIFGLHYLFKGDRVGTVGLYNLWMYGGRKSGGYLFSGTAYSSLYFSPVLAPLSVIICLCFAHYFERKAKDTNFIEWKYLHTLAFSRLILCAYIAFTGSLNIISRNYILFGIVISASHYFVIRGKNRS